MIQNNNINFAIEIDVSNDVRTIVDVNMVNGVIKFIAEGDGTGLTYEDDSVAVDFKEGYLVEKPVQGLSKKIDLSNGGAQATLNTCKVTIDNNSIAVTGGSFMSSLLSNGVYLINSRIQIYEVIDGVLIAAFGGVLSETAFNEKYLIFTAKDINEDNFKNIPENDSEQIVYGDVGYTPINKIATEQDVTVYTGLGHSYKKINSVGVNYGKTALSITIPYDLYIQHFYDEISFVGWYVKARPIGDTDETAGFDEAIQITSSSVTSSGLPGGRQTYLADIILDHPFEDLVSSGMIGKSGMFPDETAAGGYVLFNTNVGDPKFLFDLIKFNAEYIITQTDVASVDSNPQGLPYLYSYDENLNTYTSVGTAISYEDGKLTLANNNEELTTTSPDYGPIKDSQPLSVNGSYLTGASYRSLVGHKGIVDENDKFVVESVPSNRDWVNAPELVDGDYTNTISTSKGTATIFGIEIPYNFCFEYTYKYNDAVGEEAAKAEATLGVLLELEVDPSFNYADFDEVYLSMGIGVNPYPLLSFGNFGNDSQNTLYIRTLDRIQQDFIEANGFHSTMTKATGQPLTETSLELNRPYDPLIDPEGYVYDYIPTQFSKDSEVNYRTEDNVIAPMITSPKVFENDTIPEGNTFAWGGSFRTESNGDYSNKEQSITDAFVLDNDPIVVDKDGNKKILLWVTGDPNESDVFTDQAAYFWLSNIKLVGSKENKNDDLYVKTTGESFPVSEQYIGNLTYSSAEHAVDIGLEEFFVIDQTFYQGDHTVYFRSENLKMIEALEASITGDRITIMKDATTYQTYEKLQDGLAVFSGINVFSGVMVDEGTIDFAGGDLCSVTSPYRRNVGNVYSMFQNMLEVKNNFTNVEYNTLEQTRSSWEAARTIQTSTNSKDLIKNLAQQSFVGVFTNREGNIELDSFKDYADYAYNEEDDYWYWKWLDGTDFRTFNTNNIINKSIKNAKSTPVTNIINNISLDYNYDYAVSKFTERYYVTNVSADDFPDAGSDYSSFSNIPDWATAKMLWDQGHETYLRNGISKNLDKKQQLKLCNWYYTSAVGVMNSSVHYYLANLVEWITKSKNMITFRIPLNADNATIDLLERITFSDILLTGGVEIIGWATSVKHDVDRKEIELEITTVPTDLIPTYSFIDESSRTSIDTLDELPDTDINVDENFTI